MIFTIKDADPRFRMQVQTFSRLRPVPQLPSWENAARQIYLKGYEIAVKEAGAQAVMTTYGSVNGY